MTRITWEQTLARIAAGVPVEDALDEQHASDRAHFRSMLADMGERGVEALAKYDEATRNLDLGITGARMLWHSITRPQRCTLRRAGSPSIPMPRVRPLLPAQRRSSDAPRGQGALTPARNSARCVTL